jgi:hypothetical protein
MRVEIEQAQMVFRNGGCSRERAENISRLTFEYVYQMTAGRLPNGRRLKRIEAAPLRLAIDAISDRQVARAAARAVFRAVLPTAREPGS